MYYEMDTRMTGVSCFLAVLGIAAGSWPPDVPPEIVSYQTDGGIMHEPSLSSPIDLRTAEVSEVRTVPPFRINGSHVDSGDDCIKLKNTGKAMSVYASPDCPTTQTVTGGTLGSAVYQFVECHWHWGCENGKGSEHAVDGKKYDIEVHCVHFNMKYPDLATALHYDDGVAVFGAPISVDGGPDNRAVAGLVELIPRITKAGSEVPISASESLWIMKPLIEKMGTYFTYPGSLTTPDYAEAVTWHVSLEMFERATYRVSIRQYNVLKKLMTKNGEQITCNARPLQPRNSRPVVLAVTTTKTADLTNANDVNSATGF